MKIINLTFVLILTTIIACSPKPDLGEYNPQFFEAKRFNDFLGNVERVVVKAQRGRLVEIDSLHCDTIMYDPVYEYVESSFDEWGRILTASKDGDESQEYSYNLPKNTKLLVRNKAGAPLYTMSWEWKTDSTYISRFRRKEDNLKLDYEGVVDFKKQTLNDYQDGVLTNVQSFGNDWMTISSVQLGDNGEIKLQPMMEVAMLPDSVWTLRTYMIYIEKDSELVTRDLIYSLANDERGNPKKLCEIKWHKDSLHRTIIRKERTFVYRD